MLRTISRSALAIPLLLIFTVGPSKTVWAQPLVNPGNPSPTATSSPSMVVAPLELRPITSTDLAGIEGPTASAITLARYEVGREAAGLVARGYILEQGYLAQPLYECLYLPKEDIEGHVIGHFFVFSVNAECQDHDWLASHATAVAEQARADMAVATASSAWQLRAHQLTANEFYSVTISGYQFRPPLELGHQGLPLFLMDSASLPAGCTDGPRPERIVLAHQDTLYEGVQYACDQGLVLYSHYGQRTMGMDEALFADVETTLSEWRLAVLDPAGPGLPALERLNQRWTGYLEIGQTSGNQP